MSTGWEEMGLANLSARVRQLDETVDSIVDQLPGVADAMDRIEGDLHRLNSERGETGAALSRHDEQLRDLTATVRRLATQVTWIERHLRSSGTVHAVDLDHVDAELSALAATGEAGRRAAAELLSPFARGTLEASAGSHAEAAARRRAAEQALLDVCGELAGTERGQPAHREARAGYQSAKADLASAVRQVAALEEEAADARRQLAEDDDVRRHTHAAIAAGERAEAQLLTRLRTKLAAALGEEAMLPPWLTARLGPMPPAGSAQEWMDVAAGLLAYRITYGVADSADALGAVPPEASRDRRRWYEELRRGIRELER